MVASLATSNLIENRHGEINDAATPACFTAIKDNKWTTRYFYTIFEDLNLFSAILGAVGRVGDIEERVIDGHNFIRAILLECFPFGWVK